MMLVCQAWTSSVPVSPYTEVVHNDIFELATSLAMLSSILDMVKEIDDGSPEITSQDNTIQKYEGIVADFETLSDVVEQLKVGKGLKRSASDPPDPPDPDNDDHRKKMLHQIVHGDDSSACESTVIEIDSQESRPNTAPTPSTASASAFRAPSSASASQEQYWAFYNGDSLPPNSQIPPGYFEMAATD